MVSSSCLVQHIVYITASKERVKISQNITMQWNFLGGEKKKKKALRELLYFLHWCHKQNSAGKFCIVSCTEIYCTDCFLTKCQLILNTFLMSSRISVDKWSLMCELLESWTSWNENSSPVSYMEMSLPSSQHAGQM